MLSDLPAAVSLTLLNIIAGLLEPTSGEVIVDGHKVEGTGVDRGVVFQQYALFPWLTVKKNVQFGLKLQGKSQKEMDAISEKYIKMVGLEKFTDSYPKELSGGMKQRVAIARAYAVNPSRYFSWMSLLVLWMPRQEHSFRQSC